jgi:hypothetical protein
MSVFTKLAQRYLDRHARAPRGFFGVDDGMPDRGHRYGGAQTIHNTGTIDVVLDDSDTVIEVWFRCQQLAYRVSQPKGSTVYSGAGANVVAVELADDARASHQHF